MRKMFFFVAAAALVVWIFGSNQDVTSPKAARDKAYLCSLASDLHASLIESLREEGLIQKASVGDDGAYVFVVDETSWLELQIDQKELLGIAGWCRVATEQGEGVALVIGQRGRNQLASVVNGHFAEQQSETYSE